MNTHLVKVGKTSIEVVATRDTAAKPASAKKAAARLRDAAEIAASIAAEFTKPIQQVAAAIRPDELSIEFGLTLKGGANWLVASLENETAFKVTMTWKDK